MAWSKIRQYRRGAWEEWTKINQWRNGAWRAIAPKVMQYRNGAWRSLANAGDTAWTTRTWNSTWIRNYFRDGTYSPSNAQGTQGLSPSSGNYYTTMIGFDYANMRSAMSGARISSAYLTFDVTTNGVAGGTVFVFGLHNAASAANTYSETDNNAGRSSQIKVGTNRESDQNMTKAVNAINEGAARGITLNANTDNPLYFGVVRNVSLTVTYEK